jgi:hypothetical protein
MALTLFVADGLALLVPVPLTLFVADGLALLVPVPLASLVADGLALLVPEPLTLEDPLALPGWWRTPLIILRPPADSVALTDALQLNEAIADSLGLAVVVPEGVVLLVASFVADGLALLVPEPDELPLSL